MTALRISTDLTELEMPMLGRVLASGGFWLRPTSEALLTAAFRHSLCFGGYLGEQQIAFARVVTDHVTFAHLRDVFVLPEFRGRGYGIALMQAVMDHPDLQKVGFTLATPDAHLLYERFGFVRHPRPQQVMFRPPSA